MHLIYYHYSFVISWKFVMNYEILNILSVAHRALSKKARPQKFEGISQFCFDVILNSVQMSKRNWEISSNHSRFSFVLMLDDFYLIFSRLLRKVVQFFTLLQMCRVVQINFLKMSRLKLLKELVWFSTCQREHMTAARKIQSKWWEFNSFIRLSWIYYYGILGAF